MLDLLEGVTHTRVPGSWLQGTQGAGIACVAPSSERAGELVAAAVRWGSRAVDRAAAARVLLGRVRARQLAAPMDVVEATCLHRFSLFRLAGTPRSFGATTG